jgi:hypothetical protein
MNPKKAERAGGKGSQSDRVGGAPPELPTDKAFVLQLSRDTGLTLEPFTGRVEHLATGRRLRFETFAAFQAAVIRLLTDSRPRRDEGDP